MESLVVLIIFLLVSSLNRRKKRRGQPANRPNRQPQPTLTRQVRQLMGGMMQNEASSRQPARTQSTSRRTHGNVRRADADCDYCTGERTVERTLSHSSAKAPQHAVMPQNDVPVVDVAGLQKNMGLSELQNMVLWQEILDKPPALRRSRR